MVVLIRCNDILSDPRAMKYVRYLQEKGIEHKFIGWDRDGKNIDLPSCGKSERNITLVVSRPLRIVLDGCGLCISSYVH